jgi:DNA-binding MarR family transcriptional regulator
MNAEKGTIVPFYTLKAIADHLRIHYAKVSKIIKTAGENGYFKTPIILIPLFTD